MKILNYKYRAMSLKTQTPPHTVNHLISNCVTQGPLEGLDNDIFAGPESLSPVSQTTY